MPPYFQVRPGCGSCASLGIQCTGGDFRTGVRCDNCNHFKKSCGFDLRIPRLTAASALHAAAEAAPESKFIFLSYKLSFLTFHFIQEFLP